MDLQGSCHCGAVSFEVKSKHPYPYQLCYCGVCRKTAGTGGCAINLSADSSTLKVQGEENISVYNAKLKDPKTSEVKISNAGRRFCKQCSSSLWLFDSRWPELLHPFASCVDTELPVPPTRTHIMTEFKPKWVLDSPLPGEESFPGYPKRSIAEWHQQNNVVA